MSGALSTRFQHLMVDVVSKMGLFLIDIPWIWDNLSARQALLLSWRYKNAISISALPIKSVRCISDVVWSTSSLVSPPYVVNHPEVYGTINHKTHVFNATVCMRNSNIPVQILICLRWIPIPSTKIRKLNLSYHDLNIRIIVDIIPINKTHQRKHHFESANRLIDWLIGWVVDWLIEWMIDWLIDCVSEWVSDCLYGGQSLLVPKMNR